MKAIIGALTVGLLTLSAWHGQPYHSMVPTPMAAVSFWLHVTAQHPEEYPPDWFCTRRGIVKQGQQTSEHPCMCQRIDRDEHCEGEPTKDGICHQYCHEQHCHCGIICRPGTQPGEN